jgi:hypothetical protein
MVSKLKGEESRATGFNDIPRISFALGRLDLLASASYQLGFEEIHEKYKDKLPPDHVVTREGQPAEIEVDAYPGKTYRGRVRAVASVASQAEFFSSDVKVYQTIVSIDNLESEKKLKPGMSAKVTILADEIKKPVLLIPIHAVVGNVSMGAQRKCFVVDERGIPQERNIQIGKSSDLYVEIEPVNGETGVREGERVVLNPRVLLGERSDLKPATAPKSRGGDGEDTGKKGKKGDGAGKGADKSK